MLLPRRRSDEFPGFPLTPKSVTLTLYVEGDSHAIGSGFRHRSGHRLIGLCRAAHLIGADDHTGTIAVGKAADLVLVEGDPSAHIGDLRHTRLVLTDGKMMDADALRSAGGLAGRPKFAE
jgi:hypothetical protein